MNVALVGILISLVTLALVMFGHAIVVARWSGRLQTLVEIHSAEITGLRENGQAIATRVATIEGRITEHRESGA